MSHQIYGWKMTGPGAVERFTRTAEDPGPKRVLVEVAGCGVCHTDLGYLYGGVPTRAKLPLALGHEISGVVVAAGPGAERWMGRRVVVPAVWPCGECRPCTPAHPARARGSPPGLDTGSAAKYSACH